MTIKIFQIGEDFYSDGIEEWKMNNASQPYFLWNLRSEIDGEIILIWLSGCLFMSTIPWIFSHLKINQGLAR